MLDFDKIEFKQEFLDGDRTQFKARVVRTACMIARTSETSKTDAEQIQVMLKKALWDAFYRELLGPIAELKRDALEFATTQEDYDRTAATCAKIDELLRFK
jgi:hypothetical protein